MHTSTPLPGGPLGIGVASNGAAYVALFDVRQLAVLDIAAQSVESSFQLTDEPIAVAIDPGGTRAYLGVGGQWGIMAVDLSSGAEDGMSGVGRAVNDVALSRDGQLLYATSSDSLFFTIDALTLSIVDSLNVDPGIIGIAEHPTEPWIYVTARDSGRVYGLSRNPLSVLWSTWLGGRPHHVLASPDGDLVYVANQLIGVNIVKLGNNNREDTIWLDGDAFDIAFSHGGRLLWVAMYTAGRVAVVDTETRERIASFEVGGTPVRIGVFNDGDAILVTNQAGWIDFFVPGLAG